MGNGMLTQIKNKNVFVEKWKRIDTASHYSPFPVVADIVGINNK